MAKKKPKNLKRRKELSKIYSVQSRNISMSSEGNLEQKRYEYVMDSLLISSFSFLLVTLLTILFFLVLI